jgi:hypothetical protein
MAESPASKKADRRRTAEKAGSGRYLARVGAPGKGKMPIAMHKLDVLQVAHNFEYVLNGFLHWPSNCVADPRLSDPYASRSKIGDTR